jgi:hypothetical protein
MMSVDTANSTSRASPASTSGITISRNKPVSGFTTTAPLDRSKGGHASTVLGTASSAGLGSPLTTAPSASAGGVAGDKDGESSAKIVSAMINPGEGQGTPGPNSSVPAASARAGSHGNGTGSGSGKGWASGYSTPEAGLGDFKRKRDQAAQAHAQQPLRAPVNPANYEYSSDEMEEDMADDDSDEDIEREPLPGENIFSRIRGGSEEEEEDGTVLVQRRPAGHGAGDEVDELESVNGDGVEPGKLGQVKKIKLVLNNGKSKAGKMVVGPDGKARKRSV